MKHNIRLFGVVIASMALQAQIAGRTELRAENIPMSRQVTFRSTAPFNLFVKEVGTEKVVKSYLKRKEVLVTANPAAVIVKLVDPAHAVALSSKLVHLVEEYGYDITVSYENNEIKLQTTPADQIGFTTLKRSPRGWA